VQHLLQLVVSVAHLDLAVDALELQSLEREPTLTGSVDLLLLNASDSDLITE